MAVEDFCIVMHVERVLCSDTNWDWRTLNSTTIQLGIDINPGEIDVSNLIGRVQWSLKHRLLLVCGRTDQRARFDGVFPTWWESHPIYWLER